MREVDDNDATNQYRLDVGELGINELGVELS